MAAPACSIGKANNNSNSECSGELHERSFLSIEQGELLRRRSGTSRIDSVCHVNLKEYLHFFAMRHTKCCCPLELKHKKAVKTGLVEIGLELAREATSFAIPLVPGLIIYFLLFVKPKHDNYNFIHAFPVLLRI